MDKWQMIVIGASLAVCFILLIIGYALGWHNGIDSDGKGFPNSRGRRK